MPSAAETFKTAIQDSAELLQQFDALNTKPPPENIEVLKRAALIMALAAWETYVEDRVTEVVHAHMGCGDHGFSDKFVIRHLEQSLKQFNTPNSEKTRKLFSDYLNVDVTLAWQWNHYDPERVKSELDTLVKKRGEAAHRAKPQVVGSPPPHLIKRDDLAKAIRFLQSLVDATEKATATTV